MRTKELSNIIRYLIIAVETTRLEAVLFLFLLHYRLAKLSGVNLHADMYILLLKEILFGNHQSLDLKSRAKNLPSKIALVSLSQMGQIEKNNNKNNNHTKKPSSQDVGKFSRFLIPLPSCCQFFTIIHWLIQPIFYHCKKI